jgi:hypothetical protein
MKKKPKKVDADEVRKQLRQLQRSNDTESLHGQADDILAEFVADLGYPDIAELYRKLPKWYA